MQAGWPKGSGEMDSTSETHDGRSWGTSTDPSVWIQGRIRPGFNCKPWKQSKEIEAVTDFIFLDSKITADGDSNHEIKRYLLLGRKTMTNLDIVLKSRDIILPTNVRIVKAMVFPIIMYGRECWTIQEAEQQKLMLSNCDVGEDSWVSWTARRSTQSTLKEINLEHSLEGLMPKLKLQSFGHLRQRADSLEKILMLGKIEGRRRSGWQRMRLTGWHHPLNGHEFEQTPGDSEGRQPGVL